MEWVSHSTTIAYARVRTVTVDVSRGGDYALADYRRQAGRFPRLLRLVKETQEEVMRYLNTQVWTTEEE